MLIASTSTFPTSRAYSSSLQHNMNKSCLTKAVASYDLAIFIEGYASRDQRCPKKVADIIINKLHQKIDFSTTRAVVISQGDSLTATGVAPIGYLVSERLNIDRILLAVDGSHEAGADRRRVVSTIFLDELIQISVATPMSSSSSIATIATSTSQLVAISDAISEKLISAKIALELEGKKPLPSWYFDFARLQEVGKAVLKEQMGSIVLVHTTAEIRPFSVTSFYEVGTTLGLYSNNEIITVNDVDDGL